MTIKKPPRSFLGGFFIKQIRLLHQGSPGRRKLQQPERQNPLPLEYDLLRLAPPHENSRYSRRCRGFRLRSGHAAGGFWATQNAERSSAAGGGQRAACPSAPPQPVDRKQPLAHSAGHVRRFSQAPARSGYVGNLRGAGGAEAHHATPGEVDARPARRHAVGSRAIAAS